MRWESLVTMSLKIYLLEHPQLLQQLNLTKIIPDEQNHVTDLIFASFDNNFLGGLTVSCIPDENCIKVLVLPTWNYHN